MPAIMQLKELTKHYGKKNVFEGVNVDINKGELLGIIGMSGSGKTTLIKTMIGFLEPEEGDILFHSEKESKFKSVFNNPSEVRTKFGFATQVPSFYPRLTVEENLDHFGTLYRLPKKVKKNNISSLLNIMDLESEKDQLAETLAGGMEKRLGIACSLIHNPDILIMDEPTANLDPVLRDSIWQVVKDIKNMGTTVVVASHLLDELEPVCDRIGILHNHTMIEVGSPDQIKGRYNKNEEIRLKVAGSVESIEKGMKRSHYIESIKRVKGESVFYTKEPEKALYLLLSFIKRSKEEIINLEVSKPSLKEVFEAIYNK